MGSRGTLSKPPRTDKRPAFRMPAAHLAQPALLAAFALAAFAASWPARAQAPLSTVAKVDIERYLGRWYELARLPNRFQAQCAGNVVATYSPLSVNALKVVNSCRTASGEDDVANGVARVRDLTTNAKLEVRFLPLALAWLPFAWGDYWILDLAPDYSHAMVGTPSREYLWILSREPTMEDARLRTLLERARELGFDDTKVVRTPQNLR